MRHARTASRFAATLLAVPAALWIGCEAEKPTQLVAGVTTQMEVPKELKGVGVVIQADGKVVSCDFHPVTSTNGETATVQLPSTLGLIPGASASTRVTVSILGFKTEQPEFANDCIVKQNDNVNDDGVRVLRRRRTTYVQDQILYLPMPLRQACAGVRCENPEETCIAGVCRTIDVDAKALSRFEADQVLGTSNTCFHVEDYPAEGRIADLTGLAGQTIPGCFSPGKTIGSPVVKLVDSANCEFEVSKDILAAVPESPGVQGLNVRLEYDNFSKEILDREPSNADPTQMEGFFIPGDLDESGATKPIDRNAALRFRLAPNLCQSAYLKDKIRNVEVSVLCPSKVANQGICKADSDKIINSGRCGSDVLEPIGSNVLIVASRGASMAPLFAKEGSTSFADALEESLKDPLVKTIRAGLKFFPDTTATCGTAPAFFQRLTDPGDVPFNLVELARTAMVNSFRNSALLTKLGDGVTPVNPPLFVNTAMSNQGLYKLLRDNRESGNKKVNRQAVFFIQNLPEVDGGQGFQVSQGCGDGGKLEDLAAVAFGDPTAPIYTYMLTIDRPVNSGTPEDATDDTGPDAEKTFKGDQTKLLTLADKIATSGGTKAFNATKDPAEGVRAMQTVFADLSSCAYEPVSGGFVVPATEELRQATSISYLREVNPEANETARSRVNISYNPGCTAAKGNTNSGWNVDADGRVYICGTACENLRIHMVNAALLAKANAELAKTSQTAAEPKLPIQLRFDSACGTTPSGGGGGSSDGDL